MSAIETLLAGLIDYAGLYPPAALDMGTAVRNYLGYRTGKHGFALGRFIVDATRLDELCGAAGGAVSDIPLSVIVSAAASHDSIGEVLDTDLQVGSIEIKCSEPMTIRRICEGLPRQLRRFFEVPIRPGSSETIDAVASAGACAKLRMGGVVPDAFPSPGDVIAWLQLVADRRVPFKATAGLHHPIRARHRLTYSLDSPCAVMHGFLNLFCAAIFAYDGEFELGRAILEEENPVAFRLIPDCIVWRTHEFTLEHIRTIRKDFFTSFGSCSFAEPLLDLEAFGWL